MASATDAILGGMRVVEAAAFVAAPLGGMTLAQMGADVIRIDTLGGGLDHRRWPVTADDVSLFWCGLNKAKRSVALDLASAEGRELAMAIVCAPGEDAGMLLTNFPPRGWLSYETLSQSRADLIQLTIQGDRHGGSAVDYTVNARVGVPYITGPGRAEDAVNHVLPAWDVVTGQMAATALLAAERYRRREGVGQHVKLALEDVALAVMGHLGFVAEAQLGRARERHGNFLFGAFGKDFVSADGVRVMVVGLTLKQWRALCTATGSGDAVAALSAQLGLDLDREGDRFHAREALAGLIGGWIGARQFGEVARAFDASGVCWGRYQSLAELVRDDPSCSPANPMFAAVEQPGVGTYAMPGTPLAFTAMQRLAPRPAPLLGQHTEEVLLELLGLSAAAYGALHDRGVVRGPLSPDRRPGARDGHAAPAASEAMSETDPSAWRPLCHAIDVEIGIPVRVEVEGLPPLAVFQLADGFYVTDDTCTHGQASLCDGFVEGDEIECPWHSGRFCIKDGRATGFPAVEPIKAYRTKVVDGRICVQAAPAVS